MGVNDFIDENLLHFLTGSTAAAFFVAMISTFFTEAVKRTCQKVFLKKLLKIRRDFRVPSGFVIHHEGHEDHKEKLTEFSCSAFLGFVIFVV